MLELALDYGKGLTMLKDIARRQDISERYLEQIIPSLKAAALIRSFRGSSGGYSLAREPSKINMLEVITALEGPISLVDCVGQPRSCERTSICASRDLWCRLSKKIISELKKESLQDLVQKHKSKQEKPLMYNI